MAHTLKESLEARVREAERRGLGRRAPVLDRTDVGPLVMSGGRIFISYMSNDYIGLSQDRGSVVIAHAGLVLVGAGAVEHHHHGELALAVGDGPPEYGSCRPCCGPGSRHG